VLPFQTILVGADFSVCSREAFAVDCALARGGRFRLLVLHVVEQPDTAQLPIDLGDQAVAFTIVEREPLYYGSVKERMHQLDKPGRVIEAEDQTKVGEPAEQTLCLSYEVAGDLIGVGTHGRTGLDRILLGIVAEQSIWEASYPVLAPRPQVGDPKWEPSQRMAVLSNNAERSEAASIDETDLPLGRTSISPIRPISRRSATRPRAGVLAHPQTAGPPSHRSHHSTRGPPDPGPPWIPIDRRLAATPWLSRSPGLRTTV